MESERIKNILEKSFVGKHLMDKNITDIAFDGTTMRLRHNIEGTLVPDVQPSIEEVKRLIKIITDFKKTELTNSNPKVNTEFDYLRINALHEEISPDGMTFAIRISRPRLAVSKITDMVTNGRKEVEKLLKVLVLAKSNLVLCGRAGAGKTEVQKLLVGYMNDRDWIFLIEDTRDSHIKKLYPQKHIVSLKTIKGLFSATDALEEALRNNPDWVIIAETRGNEAADILDVVKTDHSIITTLHSTGAMGIPSRFIPLVKRSSSYQTMNEQLIGKDIVDYLRFGLALNPEFLDDGRKIKELVEFTGFNEEGAIGTYLYREIQEYDEINEKYYTKQIFNPLSEVTLQKLKDKRLYHLVPDLFKPKKLDCSLERSIV